MTSDGPSEEYANEPLPERLTVSGWRVALVVACFSVSLPTFLNGAQIALATGFAKAVLAAFLAGVVLCIGGSLTSIVAVRSRLNTYLLIQRSFGIRGAALVNIVIAVVHFCWFGVNVSFFGGAMVAAARDGYGIPGNFAAFVILGSILMTVTTIYGFQMLNRLALFTVPFLGAILIAICASAINRNGVVLEPLVTPAHAMTFGIALSSLIGADMLTITAMPDLSRYTRSQRGAVMSMILSFPLSAPLVMTAAALSALAMAGTDIMKMITDLGFGAPALFLLILSSWTINALNLYSASLSLTATFPNFHRWQFIVIGGVMGAVFALMGIIDAFIPFLVVLGLIIPPIAAIYVIDSLFIFRRRASADTIANLPMMRWPAAITWIGSIALALLAAYAGLTVTMVPALDATIGAAIAYALLLRLRNRRAAREAVQRPD